MRRLGLILSIVAIFAVPAGTTAGEPVTRMVDADGRAAVGDCDAGRETYRGIQEAVDDSGPGDRVLVCSGRYRSFAVEGHRKDGLIVQAVERWRAIVEGAPSRAPRTFVKVRRAEKVTIAGLRIRPAGVSCLVTGITFELATGTIQDNRIEPASSQPECASLVGISVFAALDAGGPTDVIGNVVRGSVMISAPLAESGWDGRPWRVSVAGNIVQQDWAEWESFVIHVDNHPRVAISDNVVLSTAYVLGIFTEAPSTKIRRNTIIGTSVGIGIVGSGSGIVAGNDVRHGGMGLVLHTNRAVEVRRNSVHDNIDEGIFVREGRGRVEAHLDRDNDFRGNGGVDCIDVRAAKVPVGRRTDGDGTSATSRRRTVSAGPLRSQSQAASMGR